MKKLLSISIVAIMIGVAYFNFSNQKTSENIADRKEYDKFLSISSKDKVEAIDKNIDFWSGKLNENPDQFPYKAKLAYYYNELFAATGNIKNLNQAEEYLLELNTATNYNHANYLRSLARNYITQHRFDEALAILEMAEKNGEDLEATRKMLFDVYLELGNDDQAESYLEGFANNNDFEYLIRQSKWMDHKGDLESAIYLMEEAMKKVEENDQVELKQWTYTNLADFYGHAERIADSYDHYIKALEIDPSDAYAKKGIAWIVFSHERNSTEALRIINSISDYHHAPDYHLFKAEIAEFNDDKLDKAKELRKFLDEVSAEDYGVMYNSHQALLMVEEYNDYSGAENLARMEIELRPTPQSFSLLAWTYYNSGKIDIAHEIIESKVNQQTFEPGVQYRMAAIYKAKGDMEKTAELRNELEGSIYELGPTMEDKILKL